MLYQEIVYMLNTKYDSIYTKQSILFCLNNKKKNLLGKWRFILGFAQGYI